MLFVGFFESWIIFDFLLYKKNISHFVVRPQTKEGEMSFSKERDRRAALALRHMEADSGAAILVLIGFVGLIALYTLLEKVDWDGPLNFVWLMLGRI